MREDEFEREGEGRRELGDSEKEGILPGCGRVVCRVCSFETPERYVDVELFELMLQTDFWGHCSDLNTCYDCVGRPLVQT